MGLQKLGSAIKTMLGWAVLIAIAPALILICLVAALVSREYREKLLSEVSPK